MPLKREVTIVAPDLRRDMTPPACCVMATKVASWAATLSAVPPIPSRPSAAIAAPLTIVPKNPPMSVSRNADTVL